MTIAEISLKYNQQMTDEQLAQLNASIVYGDAWERDKEGTIHYWRKSLVHIDTMPKNIEFEVHRMIDHPAFESLERKRNPAFNQKVKVVVPDIGLMKIKHVVVHTDFCTEQLQKELDRGWCILTICPQPDQRRPDYILGRMTDPNL